MSNKETILQTAIDLFNDMGTARVTTNLIAKEAGISPGNLYYHFTDKAHIIREIFERMTSDWDEVNKVFLETGPHFEDLMKEFITANFKLLWEYRFYSREMVPLINADPILKERHIPVINEHFNEQYRIIQKAVEANVLNFPDPHYQANDALTVCWIVANQYLIHLEGMGKTVTKADFQKGVHLIMNSLLPYMVR
ncbi:MAG: TetR/AcrR family transcriptional regulator [Leptolinea sp.]|nr:TetR/AcrR family transcriptional regulator [Leptolinea sp.]